MDQNSAEGTGPTQGELRSIESGLKALWERTRRAAELIAELRAEKKELQQRLGRLEDETRHLREELARKEHLLKNLASETAAQGSTRGALVTNGEREALLIKVKELLGKLEAHL